MATRSMKTVGRGRALRPTSEGLPAVLAGRAVRFSRPRVIAISAKHASRNIRVALPGTVALITASETGAWVLDDLARSLLKEDFARANSIHDSTTKAFARALVGPKLYASAHDVPIYVEFRYGAKTLRHGMFTSPRFPLAHSLALYNGGTIDPKQFAVAEYHAAGSKAAARSLIVVRQPELTAVEKKIFEQVAGAPSEINFGDQFGAFSEAATPVVEWAAEAVVDWAVEKAADYVWDHSAEWINDAANWVNDAWNAATDIAQNDPGLVYVDNADVADGYQLVADDQAAQGDQAAGDQAAQGDQAAGDQAAQGDQAAGDQAAGDQAAQDDQAAGDQGDQGDAGAGDDHADGSGSFGRWGDFVGQYAQELEAVDATMAARGLLALRSQFLQQSASAFVRNSATATARGAMR